MKSGPDVFADALVPSGTPSFPKPAPGAVISKSLNAIVLVSHGTRAGHRLALPRAIAGGHTPPSGLAFGEPDDRLQRSIQYAAAFRSITSALEYRIARFSRAVTAASPAACSNGYRFAKWQGKPISVTGH